MSAARPAKEAYSLEERCDKAAAMMTTAKNIEDRELGRIFLLDFYDVY